MTLRSCCLYLFFSFFWLSLCGCANVAVIMDAATETLQSGERGHAVKTPSQKPQITAIPKTRASIKEYKNYFVLGFAGSQSYSLAKACLDQKPAAFETYFGLEDILLGVVSLGIYTPKTVAVWCVDGPQ